MATLLDTYSTADAINHAIIWLALCSSHRATLAVYLTCRLSLLSASNLLHSHSLLLSPEGSVGDIWLFSIYRNVTSKISPLQMAQIQGFAQNWLCPSLHYECIYCDINSTTTHESLKPLTWLKESFRMGVWHLLNPSSWIINFPFLRRIYSILCYQGEKKCKLEMFPWLLTLSHKSIFIFKVLKCILKNCPHLVFKYIYL